MLKYLLFVAIIFTKSIVFAETIKVDVLVIGGNLSGTAAALQCARSKVKTLLIEPSGQLGEHTISGSINQNFNSQEPLSGIWAEFAKAIREPTSQARNGQNLTSTPLSFGSQSAAVLQQLTDTVKNLSIRYHTQWTTIRKDGEGWNITVISHQHTETIKAHVVVDATSNGEAAIKAGAIFITDADHPDSTGRQLQGLAKLDLDNIYNLYDKSTSYRTAIAYVGGTKLLRKAVPAFCIPLGAVVAKNANNILVAGPVISAVYEANRTLHYPATQLILGQGVGTVAAYCAFYKTTTRNLRVRAIQGELLDFKGNLLPFTDIEANDANWRAIQQIGATGLLQGIIKIDANGNNSLYFIPDSLVTVAEIKPVLLEIYTRAFLWFNKNQLSSQLTLGNLLSFISELTLAEPELMKQKIQKQWKATYQFKSDFDLNHPLTRREFAVLANQYLNPFARSVDLNGKVVN